MGRFVASRGEAKGAAFAEVDEAKLRLFQVLGLQLKVVLTDRSEERVWVGLGVWWGAGIYNNDI